MVRNTYCSVLAEEAGWVPSTGIWATQLPLTLASKGSCMHLHRHTHIHNLKKITVRKKASSMCKYKFWLCRCLLSRRVVRGPQGRFCEKFRPVFPYSLFLCSLFFMCRSVLPACCRSCVLSTKWTLPGFILIYLLSNQIPKTHDPVPEVCPQSHFVGWGN